MPGSHNAQRFDDVDLQIIGILRDDPQASNKQIAAKIGVSETTVANRIRAMSRDHAMRVLAQRDVFNEGYSELVCAYLTTSGENVEIVANRVAVLEEVISVSLNAGSPELFVVLRAKGRKHLDDLLWNAIGHDPLIKALACDLILRIAKLEAGLGDLSIELPETAFPQGATDKDDQIIECLLADGRMSNREIARRLAISETNVRQRLQKMHEAKQMRLGVVCDARSLGIGALAWMQIKAAPNNVASIIEVLSGLDACPFVGTTTGAYNVVVMMQGADLQQLAEGYCAKIGGFAGVIETRSHMLALNYKNRYDLIRIQ